MSTRNLLAVPVAFLLTFAPLSLFSQPAPATSTQLEQWLVELQAIQSELAPIEDAALQEPTLAKEQQELGDALIAAMITSDSTVSRKLDRLRAIMMEAHSAAGDDAKLELLAAEAQNIQPDVERARELALAQPEIAMRFTTFRASVYARMAQIAPHSSQLIARFEELERLIKMSLLRQGTNSQTGPGL